MRKTRLLMVMGPFITGGAETQTLNILQRLDRERFEVPVVCAVDYARKPGSRAEALEQAFEATRAKIYRITHPTFDPRILTELLSVIRHEQIDVVYAVLVIWGRIAGIVGRKPTISHIHLDPYNEPQSGGLVLNRWLDSRIDRLVVTNEMSSRYFTGLERLPLHKIATVRMGVDLNQFSPLGPERVSAIRSELGLSPHVRVVTIAGTLRWQKGHTFFLEMAHSVLKHVQESVFLIAGDGTLRDELGQQVQDLGIDQKVIFMGNLNRSQVSEVMAASDIIVLSSVPSCENSPSVVIEAMATGRPVVATRVGAVDEMVNDGVTGYLVPPQDSEALAQKVQYLMEHPASIIEFGHAGRRFVQAHHDMTVVQREIEQVFLAVAKQG